MSGDVNADQIIQNYFNGTTDTELSSLSHLDDPNEGMYILCGVLIAMLFVAVIIVLLAVTISKLRKREDSAVTNNNTATANNNNTNTNNAVLEQQVRTPPPSTQPVDPPPFLWRYSNGSSQIGLCNNDQLQTNIILPSEDTGDCKGFRKNLRGKWRRLVKKKSPQEVYTIPAEFRDQLKQIYVY